MATTERYPFDYSTLNKGDVIPAAHIERVTRVQRSDVKAFQLATLQLKDRMTRDLWRLGNKWTIAQRGDDLVILSDADAARYNDRMIESNIRAISRHFRHKAEVDIAQLNDEEQAQHLRSIEVHGKTMQAMMSARRQALRLTSHARTTPGLMQLPQAG